MDGTAGLGIVLGADRAGGEDDGEVVTVDFGFTLLATVRLAGDAEGPEDASSSVESPSWASVVVTSRSEDALKPLDAIKQELALVVIRQIMGVAVQGLLVATGLCPA